MKKTSWLILLSLYAMVSFGQKDYLPTFENALQSLHQTHRFNGTYLYAENGKVISKKALGNADPLANQPLNTQTAFNLASVSKQFVAISILMLQEKGQIQLSDSLAQFIPEMPYPSVTIQQLLQHTSGIPEYFELFQQIRSPLDTLNNEGLINLFVKLHPPLDFASGTQWRYCNTNYVLLVSIIEKITKQPFANFFAQYIAKPLGLKNSYVYHIGMPLPPSNRAIGFAENGETPKIDDFTYLDGVVGDGNIFSSVEDLLIWDQSLYGNKLITQKTLQLAFQPAILKDGTTHPYGLGWAIGKPGSGVYWHTGGWTGFRNVIIRDTKLKRTTIVLSSGSNGNAIQAAIKFSKLDSIKITPTTLIQNIVLMDGTGTPARNAAVRIEGKKIIAVGNLKPFANETIIDGEGKILAPGFIDSHSHLGGSLKKFPEALGALNQGVTTIVSGQDGDSYPVDTIKANLLQIPAAINVATYTGHTSIREQVMGSDQLSRPATAAELEKIKILLQEDLKKGSLGLSTGLEYEGAFYSSREEVIELAKTTAAAKGKYISHIRSEDITMTDAIDEIIQIGRIAKLPVQISHIKLALKDDWNSSALLIAQLQQARNEGIDITADCYPYDFWNSTIRVLFPKKDFDKLAGAQFATDHLFDPDGSVMVRFAPDSNYRGKTVGAIAKLRNETPAQTLLYLVATAAAYEVAHPQASGIETIMGKSMTDRDIINFLTWGHTNVCSDGANGGHPRGYGSFTRILSRYVKELKVMSWETAIHKMTALSAEHTGISNRGTIAPGYFADLVLIDPNTVKDNANIANPKALSDGIEKVWVNGQLVYQNKTHTGAFPGEFVGKEQ